MAETHLASLPCPQIIPKELSVIRYLILALLIGVAHAAPQPVQLCPISANTFAVPTKPTDLLRTVNSASVQSCVAYSALTPDLKLYGGTPHAWQTQAALGITPYQPPVTPPVTPPVQPTCPNTFVPVNWSCTSDGKTATCTAPLNASP